MKRICVFAGSSSGVQPQYLEAADALGRALAGRQIGIVYGGARVGLMGTLADAALAAGGEVIGVIPSMLVDREIAHGELTDLRIVASMHERKAMMNDLSDAFIALPGGLGTLEEMFEVLTWAQLGLHRKPTGILNVEGYFDRLLEFLEHSVREGFLRQQYRETLAVSVLAEELLDILAHIQVPLVDRSIAREET
jgi:uncharacterized protein (TIGR00730 family)